MSAGIVAAILVVLAAVVLLRLRRKRHSSGAGAPGLMRELRLQILRSTPEEIGLEVADDEPFAVVMDLGFPGATVSVVAAANGDASLYLSTGGGVLGGIAHENVRRAAVALVRESSRHINELPSVAEYPYPETGNVRFYIRTRQGVHGAERSEEGLVQGKDPLSSLYYAGQAVITELRHISETGTRAAG